MRVGILAYQHTSHPSIQHQNFQSKKWQLRFDGWMDGSSLEHQDHVLVLGHLLIKL
jgi:hypothetical protein